MREIVKISAMADALRNTGYKNIESAMSEIIDNSIQWYAKNVFVIVTESFNKHTGRNHISEIAFLDDGCGMDEETLGGCLAFGFTTNSQREGMGRFGVGLPQASMYACPRVEVYSWQEDNGIKECKKVYLDMNGVKSGEETSLADPILEAIPDEYRKYIKYKFTRDEKDVQADFSKQGTLVIWRNCDRVNPKTVPFLFDRLDLELGRRFRYFIENKESNIRLISKNTEKDIMPNDPLLLMDNNIVLGNINKPGEIELRNNKDYTVPLFEPYTNEICPDGVIDFPVKYNDPMTGEIKDGKVKIRFSRVKSEFYDKSALSQDPGSTKMGKYVKKLEGISIVRANREIDFGNFDFYDITNEPQHRWWGCEISFEPYLDEAFGVANNKQHVELKALDFEDYQDDEVKPMWIQLYSMIHDTINEIYKKNKERRENSRSVKEGQSPATEIINTAESKRDDKNEGIAEEIKKEKGEEKLSKEIEKQLIDDGIKEPTKEDIVIYMNNKVNISYKSLGKFGGLFDYSFELGTAKLIINTDHIFYQTTLEKLFMETDVKTAFELLFASFVKAVDVTKEAQAEANDKLVSKWNERLKEYISEQYNKN